MNIQDRLSSAISEEKINLVKSVMDEGADPNLLNRNNETPLMTAAECESEEILELLISLGAVINRKGYEGNTPLHIAVDMAIDGNIQSGGNSGDEPINIISALIRHGADIHAMNNKGDTPLDWAKEYHSMKVIEVLYSANSEEAQTHDLGPK
jgi:uncharacterized protein